MSEWFPIDLKGKSTAPDMLAAQVPPIPFATRNNVDSVFVADQAAANAVQVLINNYDALSPAKLDAIARIRREAAMRADRAVAAADRDIAIVKMLTLIAKNISSPLSAAERSQLVALRDSVAPIVPVSASRDNMITAINAMTDANLIQSYDETLASRWP